MTIKLEISLPDRVYATASADKVVLPVKEGNLTVILGRAPRSQLLTEGIIALLDVQNKTLQSWRIGGGIAEIANDVCKVAVEQIEQIL
ncbi:MAG: hypothetical protein IJS26_00860 [Alphaproteobacteria bacterium]|nr:hypothetical protein [Alphaproteobacteria bacterium]